MQPRLGRVRKTNRRIWKNLDSATDYPLIVHAEHPYDFDGPERVLLTTCSGSFDSTRKKYDQISIVIALPNDRST